MIHFCYINNQIMPISEASIGINDLGLLRAYGIFDYFRTYKKRPFLWDWYWERFENSAKSMNLEIPLSKQQTSDIIQELIKLTEKEDCGVRLILTGGYSDNSISSVSPNFMILTEDIHSPKPEEYSKGIKVISYEYQRDLPDVKSTDYKHLMLLQKQLKAQNATDVLFYQQAKISELSRSNLFMIKNEVISTPKDHILKGVTRRLILELIKDKYELIERDISLEEVFGADEVFTTSSTKQILPINTIDSIQLKNERIITNQLFDLLQDFILNRA